MFGGSTHTCYHYHRDGVVPIIVMLMQCSLTFEHLDPGPQSCSCGVHHGSHSFTAVLLHYRPCWISHTLLQHQGSQRTVLYALCMWEALMVELITSHL